MGDHAVRPGAAIEAWRREYNEERPKRSLRGLTPAQFAKQLAIKAVTIDVVPIFRSRLDLE
jgi:transposase InsO family protein